MSTRNEDRLGVKDPTSGESSAATAAVAQQPAGLDFNFAMPTEFVELPSAGELYPSGHPLHQKDSLEIKHMTTKEEDILNSQTLLKQGKVFDRLIASVMCDKSVDVNSLLVCDKNAIIVALRKHNYGSDYRTEVTCPKCSEPGEQSFDLDDCIVRHGVEDVEYDVEVERTSQGTALIKNLPVSNWTFEVKPITGVEEKQYLKKMENSKKSKVEEGTMSGQIAIFTKSINEVADRPTIARAIAALPAKDSKILRKAYDLVFPSYEMKVEFECSNCSHSERMDLPFTADFFWSNR
jgi:hypothetical protein